MFNLTEVKLPFRSCKLTSVFLHATGLSSSAKQTFLLSVQKMSLFFFKKNTQPTLGTLNETAGISASDFVLNEYIGNTCIFSDPTFHVRPTLSDVGFMFPGSNNTANLANDNGEHGSVFEPLVVKGGGESTIYVAGVMQHVQELGGTSYGVNFDATDNVKIHFHFEY